MKKPTERFEFSPMPERERVEFPNGARVAVYTLVCIEEWNIDKPVAREYVSSPAGVVTIPNVPNWAWHEYGMRVGIWRILESLEKRGLVASAPINASVFEGSGEPVARALKDAGWPFMGHGYEQAAIHTVSDQRTAIARSFEALKAYTGEAPKGWLGPGLHETLDTVDYLAETGFKFVCDWPMDEHPVRMQTSAGEIMAMPFSFEAGDLPMMVVHQHESTVWLDRMVDQFDRLYQDGATQPRVMSMSLHPFISGVPHRIKYLEAAYDYMLNHSDVWFTTADEIYDWFASSE